MLSDGEDSQQDKEFVSFLSEQEKKDFTKWKRRQQKTSWTSAELEAKLITMKNELNTKENELTCLSMENVALCNESNVNLNTVSMTKTETHTKLEAEVAFE